MHLNHRLLPALILLLLLLQLFLPHQAWTILLVGLGGALLIAFLWARLLARNLELVREMRFGWAQVGDLLEERFTLVNRGWLPALWAEVLDHSTLPGYGASTATGVGGEEANSWTNKSTCTRRGAFRLGPTTVRTGDPFGLYTITLDYASSTTVMIMPPIVPLPDIQVASGGRTGEGREQVNTFERTVSAASIRDYHPGDSLATIHWRTSARRDDLFSKRFDSTPSSDWWIVLDLDATVQVGESGDGTAENGIILAASLVDRGLRSGRSVGLVATGEDLVWLSPAHGEGQRWDIMKALALVSPGSQPLGGVLAQLSPSLGRRASLIVITPDASGGWLNSLLGLTWQGLVPTVLILDPATFGQNASRGTSYPILDVLSRVGVTRYLLSKDVFDRPEARPGQEGKWDWRVSATGAARAIHGPLDTNWRTLP